MADSFKGERARCACGSEGEIVERSGRFEFKDRWFVIRHERGTHRVEQFWNGEAFRFRMADQ